MTAEIDSIMTRLQGALRLLLDYDGTLADFAPTPDHILPDEQLIELLQRLVACDHFQVAVISGRRLSHIQALLPVEGITLAGSYGIELQLPDGSQQEQLDYDAIRPHLERIKPGWEQLIDQRDGFYLEDKGWSLAIHARFADDGKAEGVISQAGDLARSLIDQGDFQLLGGHKFLEVSPQNAHKGQAVVYILEKLMQDMGTLVYIGDDDKDEKAFSVVNQLGGLSIVVAERARESNAHYRLRSPAQVRELLHRLVDTRRENSDERREHV